MADQITRIRWHGRGGQGAITAAKIVANAAFSSGFEGVMMVPTFGTERRGAPVSTSLKIARNRINDQSPTQRPDIVVVLDHMIMEEVNVLEGLRPGGLLVLNTPKPNESYSFQNLKLATADVTGLYSEAGLRKGIVNSGIIGVLAKASELLEMDILAECIASEFAAKKPEANAKSAWLAYERTVIGERS